jgi:hypothetical protein
MSDGERKAALDFAAKIRAAAERRTSERQDAASKEKARKAAIDRALDRLFDDLEAMGDAAGVLSVTRKGRSIVLSLEGRRIRIVSKPSKEAADHLEVDATGVKQTLSGSFSAKLDRWALHIVTPAKGRIPERSQVYALLGSGMAWLVEHGLGLDID